MPSQPDRDDKKITGSEPRLGGDSASPLTGYEPLLGGVRRAAADTSHLQHLIDEATAAAEKDRLLEFITSLGQADAYARELAQIVPARARHRVGNWQGTFTPTQRIHAMQVLARIGSYESIVPLIDTLDDSQSQVREAAADALTAVCSRLNPRDKRTKVVYRVLVEALGVVGVGGRKVVANILATSDPARVVTPLMKLGLRSEAWQARREAAWVLGKLQDNRAIPGLVKLTADDVSAARTSAAWALGQIDSRDAVEPLAELFSTDSDEVVRAAAVEALAAQTARLPIDDPLYESSLALIITGLKDTDAVRYAALESLAAFDSYDARRVVRRLLG